MRSALLASFGLSACMWRSNLWVGRNDAQFALDPAFAHDGIFVLDLGAVDNLNWTPQGLAVQTDGRLVLGGTGGTTTHGTFAALRLRDDGALDASFGVGGIAEIDFGYPYALVQSVRLQDDGKVIVTGEVASAATGGRQVGVARLLANGALDPSFA